MKRILLLTLISCLYFSCKNEPAKDYMIFSGTLENYNNSELRLTGFDFDHKIPVNKDGTFSDTLKINNGYYRFYDGKKMVNLYLNKTDDLSLQLNVKDSTNTISFEGANSNENSYLLQKDIKTKEVLGDVPTMFSLNEDEFLQKSDSAKTELTKLAKSANLNNNFLAVELKNIAHTNTLNLNNYEGYHGYFTKNTAYKVSENFPKPFNNLNLDDENSYKNSSSFRNILNSYFYKLANENSEKNDTDFFTEYLVLVNSKVKSEVIKNSLLYDSAKYSITYTDNLKDYYTNFMAFSTDEKHKKEITKAYNKLKKTAKGQPSPKFVDYENHKGGTTSLDDLKGKYVYIDVWATWCGPCIREIPSLKKVEKEYHGKNIEFVSISIDKKKDYEAWKKMVVDKELGGIQILAEKDWDSQFVKDYSIKGIPRFILIDPQGKIVTPNAPRPSSPKLVKLFNELKI